MTIVRRPRVRITNIIKARPHTHDSTILSPSPPPPTTDHTSNLRYAILALCHQRGRRCAVAIPLRHLDVTLRIEKVSSMLPLHVIRQANSPSADGERIPAAQPTASARAAEEHWYP